jgi:hypothetical protein
VYVFFLEKNENRFLSIFFVKSFLHMFLCLSSRLALSFLQHQLKVIKKKCMYISGYHFMALDFFFSYKNHSNRLTYQVHYCSQSYVYTLIIFKYNTNVEARVSINGLFRYSLVKRSIDYRSVDFLVELELIDLMMLVDV